MAKKAMGTISKRKSFDVVAVGEESESGVAQQQQQQQQQDPYDARENENDISGGEYMHNNSNSKGRRRASSFSIVSPLPQRHNAVDPPKPRSNCLSILFGQIIAFIYVSTNATSFTLSYQYNVKTQLFQLFWMYALLSLHLFFRDTTTTTTTTNINVDDCDDEEVQQQQQYDDDVRIRRNNNSLNAYRIPFTNIVLRVPWYIYSLCGVLDVLPNFLTLLSFQYTSLTSTTLLGTATAAPGTMLFARIILSRIFTRQQYFGVILCVLGGILTLWSDTSTDTIAAAATTTTNTTFQVTDGTTTSSSSIHPTTTAAIHHSYLGDLMAIGASLFYALGDTIAEYSIKNADRYEYLGMLGLNGMILTGITFPIFEGQHVMDLIFHTADPIGTWSVFVLYVGGVVLFYMSVAYFLVASDVTLLVLSLQTANLWAVLFSLVAYHLAPPPLFYVAAVLVVSGVTIYQWSSSSGGQKEDEEENEGEDVLEVIITSADDCTSASSGNEMLALTYGENNKRDYETIQ